ncbi:hypothetical protein N7931_12195 [Catenovulum sp. 2E275]|uniref:hypothetical protein n=1 Tax=Catenovulum sp. 2E275 TaxID=2980497 RepID=UPI0021D37FBB|nr:hypothetical protein [Catenovulum sp. 2E275]MCU4676389.1 hypothetical protein [Catenovulum sp. 2E275]
MKSLPIILSALILLSACSSNKLSTSGVDNLAKQQALNSDQTPEQAIEEAQDILEQAAKDKLDFYTPLHFNNAQQSLAYIGKLQTGEEKSKELGKELAIITAAFKTKELINSAYKTKQLIEQTLADSLAHIAVLDELNVKADYPKTYTEVQTDLVDLFKLIEQKKVEDARKEQSKLLADMAELEINTLIKRHVSPAERVLDKAEDNDADDYAEQTFEQAEQAIAQAKAFINKNYREREQVKQVSKKALIAAQRAFNIGKESLSMVKLNEEKAEQKALEMESLIKVIRDAMQANEIEGLSIQEQAAELAALASLGYRTPAGLQKTPAQANQAEQTADETDNADDSVLTPLDSSFMRSFGSDTDSDNADSDNNEADAEISTQDTTELTETESEVETTEAP